MKADLLKSELGIETVQDMISIFPFRHVDKTTFIDIKDIGEEGQQVLLKVNLYSLVEVKGVKQRRLKGIAKDATGYIELVWFKGVSYVAKSLEVGKDYVVYGRVSKYKGKVTLAHPEMDLSDPDKAGRKVVLDPVYSSTEILNNRGIDTKVRRKIIKHIFSELPAHEITESFPQYLIEKLELIDKASALKWIHIPTSVEEANQAVKRLKFEEVFYLQMAILYSKKRRQVKIKGLIFSEIGKYFTSFYDNNLGFELTNAQKKVVREIRADLGKGIQMNRMLQGDVGSGKTIVALLSMLIALDNGFQACMMAPTEILAQQHYQSLQESLQGTGVQIGFLSGSVKGKARKTLLKYLKDGDLHILVGTHAVLEDPVEFKHLGLAVIDEQHRFGVAQRSRLWNKNEEEPPHILVMTATPIPRTLAMTVYGDLDISVIDELPPGRKEIKTVHRRESQRFKVIEFIRKEIQKGRQIYIVFPLIEESETLDLENLQEGFERLRDIFPPPEFQISVVHGRMKPVEKDLEMQRFVEQKTQIMVATTVIEVGVNVPNASVMIIENTERFGLSQLHQLRGRVGRGAEQSYCILMSGNKLTHEAKERIHTMVSTNDGFKIAEVDLRLRGPGELMGTKQSGVLSFQLASLIEDQAIVKAARAIALRILDHDEDLRNEINIPIRNHLKEYFAKHKDWGRIS